MEKYAIGIDIGGTKIEAAIVSEKGVLLDRLRISTESSRGADVVIENLMATIEQLATKHSNIQISALGLGIAGQVERYTGNVVYAPNLKWTNINLKEPLEAKFGMPVFVCNDVRAAAWGEWLAGAGVGCRDLVCVFVGTGVGGAIISNGSMVDGYNNTAGEIGHITVKMDGPSCTCGNRGCLEAIAGGWAIERDARQYVAGDTFGGRRMLALADGDINAITAKVVTTAAQEGDKAAVGLMDNVVDVLISSITSIVNTLGPRQIILGGGIIEGMPEIVTRIDKGVKSNSLHSATSNVLMTRGKLHNNAGAVGAALFALQTFSAQ